VVLVDVAGSRELRAQIEHRIGDALTRTLVAGVTHLDAAWADATTGDARTSVVFVPEQMRRRAHELGWAELNRRYCAALREFAASARGWLRIERGCGPDEVEAAYLETLENSGRPERAFVLTVAGGS
jgi:hypothetical protein